VYREFCLNLKAMGMSGERLHEASRENPITRQHVFKDPAEQQGHCAREHSVSPAVSGTVSGSVLTHSGSDHHIEPLLLQQIYEGWRNTRIVCSIPVNHDVNVRVYISKHSTNNVALSFLGNPPNEGTCIKRFALGVICRIVVENPTLNARQTPLK
jgi:hypothetical protein